MTTENTTIRINPNKPSTLEFDVMISGLDKIKPTVRFVIHKANKDIDWVVHCTKLDGTKWQASFPKFENFKASSCDFSVEVIVDEYFFNPAQGTIEFINTPDITFKPTSGPKPSVTTSFTVKQDDDEPIKPKKSPKKKVVESEITGQYAPTNDLLVPEEKPEDTQSETQDSIDDEQVNVDKLGDFADEITPGAGEQYPQDDEKEEFDPEKVAEAILQNAIGKAKAPTLKGSLFKRDADGKIIVPGLESDQQKQEKAMRDQKVKDILKQ